MVFGISYGELAAIVVVGAVAFGPKDLPIIARTAGRLVGQAVGYVSALRSRAQTFAEKTQLDELHKELQQTMSQLEAIRYEIRSGANILVPGSMTNRLATRAIERVTNQSSGKNEGNGTEKIASLTSTSVEAVSGHQLPSSSFSDTASLTAKSRVNTSVTSLHILQQAFPNREKSSASLGDSQSQIAACQSAGNANGAAKHFEELLDRRRSANSTTTAPGGFETLPISALSAGLIPKRADDASGGADILSDAIIERQISLQAKDFIRNMSKPPDPP